MKKIILTLVLFVSVIFMLSSCVVSDSCKHDDASQIVLFESMEATCQESGLTQGIKCNLCGTMVLPQAVVPKVDCVPGDWIVDNEPTATSDGKKHTECMLCGETLETLISTAGSVGLAYRVRTYEDSCAITGIGTCTDNEVVIPTYIDGYKVTKIDESAFEGCTTITTIVIPDSVEYIGNYAFSGCTSFGSVTIPNGVTEIGTAAFSGCIALKSVDIPSSITTVGSRIFENCTALESVTLNDSLTNIGYHAFAGCTSIQVITLPVSLVDISWGAFLNCTSLETINFKGTADQWNAVVKHTGWSENAGSFMVSFTE